MDKLSIEPTPQAESLFHAVEGQRGLRIKLHKVSVPVPHRIQLLGVYCVEEHAKLDRVGDVMGWREEGWERSRERMRWKGGESRSRGAKGGGRRRDRKGGERRGDRKEKGYGYSSH